MDENRNQERTNQSTVERFSNMNDLPGTRPNVNHVNNVNHVMNDLPGNRPCQRILWQAGLFGLGPDRRTPRRGVLAPSSEPRARGDPTPCTRAPRRNAGERAPPRLQKDGAPMANQCSYQGHVPARLPQGNPRVAPPRPAARVRDAIAAARRHAARDGRFVEVNAYGVVSAKDREVQPLAPCQEARDLQAGRRPGSSERTFGAPLPDPFRVPLLGPLSWGPYELPN